ncbi:MAG TPA: hypothetical protein VH540_04670 [Ktedonobacterales bacterium]|jgi:hypothetical protein
MASISVTRGAMAEPLAQKLPLIGNSVRFDRLMGVLAILLVSGLYLDGWAHGHGKVDKSFFTPWHGVMYSMFFITAIMLWVALYRNHTRGYAWSQAIPSGYGLSLIATPLFVAAGAADLVWHTLFGFEVGIEPLLSPSHLALATTGVLIVTGPMRATWRRVIAQEQQGWRTLLPLVLSLISTLMIFTFFTEFAHAFTHLWTITELVGNSDKSFGAANILLQAGVLMGFILLPVRRWRLPLGSMTLLFSLYAVGLSVLGNQYQLIPGAVLAGMIADGLLWVLQPTTDRAGLRAFAFAVPAILYLAVFLTAMLTGPVYWSIHLWLGSVVMAGVVGLSLSYLLVPPQEPVEQPANR